jgi:CRISPR type III-A-associated protein Csm2
MKSIVKKVNIEKWFCFLDDNTFCHVSKFNWKDMIEWLEIEYEFEETEKWKSVTKIISIKKWEEKLSFWNDYIKNFDDFSKALSLDYFQNNIKSELESINSNSALRNVYDTYLKILEKEDFNIEIEILFAKIAYQEKRKAQKGTILPEWFTVFLRKIFEEKLSSDKNNFKKFLEVFISYHKYFTWKN